MSSDIPLHKTLLFSGVSGAIATTCIYPIDLIKTKLQDQKTKVGQAKRYNGPLDCFIKIAKGEGIGGIYRGWPPNVLLVMPEKALKLTLNDYFRSTIIKADGSNYAIGGAISGGLAGFFQVMATNPMELLKIQGATQLDKFQKGKIPRVLSYSELTRQLGFTGLYAGVVSTWLRDVPFSVVYFSLYAYAKDWTDRKGFTGNLGAFIAGSMAGTTAAAMSTPNDVIKTRVHSTAVGIKEGETFWTREIKMIRSETAKLYQKEGAAAFFKGVIPRCMIISPLFAITMSCYEFFKTNC